MNRILPFFLMVALGITFTSNAQYLEAFNTANKGYLTNLANDFSGVNWSLSPWSLDNTTGSLPGRDIDDYFYTTGGSLQTIDLDHEVYWESPLLNISSAGTVSLNVDLSWIGFDNDVLANSCISGPYGTNATLDVIKVMYSINGGAYVMVSNKVGGAACATIGYANGQGTGINGNTTVNQAGLSGNTLRIRVIVNTNANAELVTIDNVSVPQAGVTLSCTQPTITAVPSNIVCNGPNSGAIRVTASGATAPYNVSWTGPSSGNPGGNEIATSGGSYSITGLAAGSYTVTVTDATGCSQSTPAIVSSAPLTASGIVANASCGLPNGTIDLSVSGGNPPYTYEWSNGPTTQDITAVAGSYTVTIRDNSSPACSTQAMFNIGTVADGPYLESFNNPNKGYLLNLENDLFGVNWTLTPWTTDQPETGIGRGNEDYFQTTAAGKLESIDTDAEVCWVSPMLYTSNSGTFQFSVDLAWTGFNPEDYIKVQYSLNGGAFQSVPNVVGGGVQTVQYISASDLNGTVTVTVPNLTANTIQIRVCVLTNANAEIVTIDNVSIPQTVSLCAPALCPALSTAPANVGITNSVCGSGCTVGGGVIAAPGGTPCPQGSVLQYQVNGGAWTTTLPVYAQTGPAQTIKTRCACEADNNITSPESSGVTTAPGVCNTPVVNAPTVTQPTCASPSGTIIVNATGVGTLEYSINNGAGYQASNTFSLLTPGNYNIRVRPISHPDCFASYAGNPVTINTAPAPVTWYIDADNDGFGGSSTVSCNRPVNGKLLNELNAASNGTDDCNDGDNSIYPGAPELCDGKDNDCDNQTDEGCNEIKTWYRDTDGDGYGRANLTRLSITQPAGYVDNPNDCNDYDPTIYLGAPELPDGKDNDCDGDVDEGLDCRKVWYRDADGDGFGRSVQTRLSCVKPDGYVDNANDCNDYDATIYTGAPELADGKDNDCDGDVDEGLECRKVWYRDADGDGRGRTHLTKMSCVQPAGYADNANDCNDLDPTIYPGAPELCDGKDNNCNGTVDELCNLITSFDPERAGIQPTSKTGVPSLEARVWPNPANNEVWVSLDAFVPNEKAELSIMQVDGKIQQTKSVVPAFGNQQVRFDVSRSAAGFYIMQVRQNELTVNKRFLIIR